MCGIVGYVGGRSALRILLDGLQQLEYRGYDSAGVVVTEEKGLYCEKEPGKVAALRTRINGRVVEGRTGLGHTRWATHGGVTRANAHPHFSCDGRIGVVHNGIIENYSELRGELKDHRFSSATDTEVIPHLIEESRAEAEGDPLLMLQLALRRVRGSYALGVVHADFPDLLMVARSQCPLVIGLGEGENFVASDISALLPHTRRVVPLNENDFARIDASGVSVFDRDLKPRRPEVMSVEWNAEAASKGGFPHFMAKEIHQQQETVAAELAGRGETLDEIRLPRKIDRIVISACGTAWHSGLVGKTAIEEMARLPVEVGFASELRYGDAPLGPGTMMVAISQSGETADTLAAARMAREAGSDVLAVTNSKGSSLAQEADQVLFMRSGLEVGVAATKTYTSQLIDMLLLALHLGRHQGTLSRARFEALLVDARKLPDRVGEVLQSASQIEECARRHCRGYDFMYLGRRYNLATAYEGALKMKEISYLHAEGYGAGEMKHGPLALVDERMVCVAVAPQGRVTEKMVSNIQEVRARNGRVISIATKGNALVRSVSDEVLEIPACEEMFSPVLAVIPLQLLAYQTAVELGRDVDRPRNLAKSVTVE